MGDYLATIDMGRKLGDCAPLNLNLMHQWIQVIQLTI